MVEFSQYFGPILLQTIGEISFDQQLGRGSRTTFSMSVYISEGCFLDNVAI